MATQHNFRVKNGLEVGGQEVISSSGIVTSAALGGQTVSSSSSPTFSSLTITNNLGVSGNLNLTGDLNITGDVNSVSVTDLDVTDKTITLGVGQTESASSGSGIIVAGSNASLLWDESSTEWDFNNSINVTGSATVSGTVITPMIASADGTQVMSVPNTGVPIFYRGAVFNENSNDSDFRVESNNHTHMLIVDASADRVGIGKAAPDAALDIEDSSSSAYGGLRVVGAGTGSGSSNAVQIADFGRTSSGSVSGVWIGGRTDETTGIIGSKTASGNIAFEVYQSGWKERMRIKNNGNVGIGTNNPSNALVLTRESAGQGEFGLRLEYTDTQGPTATSNAILVGSYGMKFKNYNSSRDFLFETGDVGIGTNNPRGKLHITGTGTYNHTPGQNTTSDVIVTSSEMGDNNYHSIMQLISVRQSLSTGSGANGYLGFTTMDDSNAQGVRDAGRIAIVNENGTSRNSATALSFWTNSGGTDTNAAEEHMRISSGGFVGIGTESPAIELDIKRHTNGYPLRIGSSQGEGRAIVYADVHSSPTKYNWIAGTQYNINNGYEITPSTAVGGYTFSNPAIVVLSNGNVGIGTNNPQVNLHVDDGSGGVVMVTRTNANTTGDLGTVRWGNTNWDSNLAEIVGIQDGANDSARLEFKTQPSAGSTATRMRITSAGKVGIGAISSYGDPNRLLSVYSSSTQSSGFNDVVEFLAPSQTGGGVSVNFGVANSTKNVGKVVFNYAGSGSNNNYLGLGFYDADNLVKVYASGTVQIGSTTAAWRKDSNGSIYIGDPSGAYNAIGTSYTGYNSGNPQLIHTPHTTPGSGILITETHFKNSNGGSTANNNRHGIRVDAALRVQNQVLAAGQFGIVSGQQSNAHGWQIYPYATYSTRYSSWNNVMGTNASADIGTTSSGFEQVTSYGGSGAAAFETMFQSFNWHVWPSSATTGLGASLSSSSYVIASLDSSGNMSIDGSLSQNASDERLKENITVVTNAINKVKGMRGVEFDWKESTPQPMSGHDIGLIAQEVQEVCPEAVSPAPFDQEEIMVEQEPTEENGGIGQVSGGWRSKSGEDYLTVDTNKIVPILIEAIKELEARIAELEG